MKNGVEQIFRANKFRADDHDPSSLPNCLGGFVIRKNKKKVCNSSFNIEIPKYTI
jgi:hypothetical protein